MVEYCEFFFRANLSWSILYTRTTFGISFTRIVSLSQDSSNIKLCCSKFTDISRSWSRRIRYAIIRAFSSLKTFILAGTSTLLTYTCSLGAPSKVLEGSVLFSLCLKGIFPFGIGCWCLFFWRVEVCALPQEYPLLLPFPPWLGQNPFLLPASCNFITPVSSWITKFSDFEESKL